METLPAFTVAPEHHHRLLVEALTDHAVFMLDAIGRIVTWSPGAELMMGFVAHEEGWRLRKDGTRFCVEMRSGPAERTFLLSLDIHAPRHAA
ncbi:MAG: PAS domain-containing protein [Myxococcales bacterium]